MFLFINKLTPTTLLKSEWQLVKWSGTPVKWNVLLKLQITNYENQLQIKNYGNKLRIRKAITNDELKS